MPETGEEIVGFEPRIGAHQGYLNQQGSGICR